MPPAALTSAAAMSVPFLSCAPDEALGPVIGPATPILICAAAVPANATANPSVRPSVVVFLMASTPLKKPQIPRLRRRARGIRRSQFKPSSRQKSPTIRMRVLRFAGLPASPGESAGAGVEPTILGRHLGGTGRPEAEQAKCQAGSAIDRIIVQRQQGSADQG